MKDKITGVLITLMIALFIGGLLYLAIKYPPKYPIYEGIQIPSSYPPV